MLDGAECWCGIDLQGSRMLELSIAEYRSELTRGNSHEGGTVGGLQDLGRDCMGS